MSTFLILGYALCSTALFFQIVGLILLHRRKNEHVKLCSDIDFIAETMSAIPVKT